MEAIGIAANLIAVVDLTVKISSACLKYSKDVKNASADIEMLSQEVMSLQRVTEQIQALLNKSDGKKLKSSMGLVKSLEESKTKLQSISDNLKPSKTYKLKRKFRISASLKWPFKHEDVEKIVQHFQQQTQIISLTLQTDQT
ncbi:uncharacterized protein BROUX77_006683 [Berkeleyomyces rouxiae]|uniref:uncharacterized protein n=1 Tax=Berkeleyomyces rouxiae TaxID=2035830 RepID=UPI003B7AF0D7